MTRLPAPSDDLPFLNTMWEALDGAPAALARLRLSGAGDLPSAFATTELAAAAVAVAGLAVAEYIGDAAASVIVDRRLSAFWFASSLRPQGWETPSPWDAVAGDYATADGWIRLHTNAPHHRAAALAVLGLGPGADRAAVARAVEGGSAQALEDAVVAHGGCAARMRCARAWREHAQGQAVAAEPLLLRADGGGGRPDRRPPDRARPLRGIRVLDLTRVIAGPVATRFMAGYGADVLRIDPPDWEEAALEAEMTPGKRCARLDLKSRAGRETFEALLREADVLVHGYRADALDRLGLGAERRRQLRPGLVDVALDAWGWSGPWRERRGFDSLVQMSTGLARTGMEAFGRDRPTPLPVQALDHAAGYLLAAAAIRGLDRRRARGEGSVWRSSLARVAMLLQDEAAGPVTGLPLAPEGGADRAGAIETTPWGPAMRLQPPLVVDGAPLFWERAASRLGSAPACW
jgi:crotonobetainyl-CoA:carnitine CoA-transferase CaiB-like acyl-CoA transferase